jgi:hypothetical protein
MPETWNKAQDPGLLSPLELRLASDEAVVIASQIVLAKLHHGVGLAAGAGIHEADRLHRAVAERVETAMGHDLDGQAPLEELRAVEIMDRG